MGLSIETVRWMQPGEWIFVNTKLDGQKIGIPGEVRWIRQVASTRIGSRLSPVYHVGVSVFLEDVQPEWHDLVAECASEPGIAIETMHSMRQSQTESSSGWEVAALDDPAD